MADYITNVLNILRLLKPEPNHTGFQHLHRWVGEPFSEALAARMCAYVLENAEGAEAVIRGSGVPAESAEGLCQTTGGLRTAFSPAGINGSIGGPLPTLVSSIALFATFAGSQARPSDPPKEALDLVVEVEAMIAKLGAARLDPLVHEIAIRHLRVLVILLKNVQAFGVDSATVAYSELIVRLRRAVHASGPDTEKKMRGVWPTLKTWWSRLEALDNEFRSGWVFVC
ncbi:hypothetical protein [Phenylobacterium sp.]|uniref:hypothetical protein n=1 Tax=Phenylobacterium sp. TaxID=1871053 RepID=UPI002BFC4F79|nr:hypothetical protein [Phenylobacterium sp.]HLZ75454.1 hypothetical protein [Phenylobacterium sp.]